MNSRLKRQLKGSGEPLTAFVQCGKQNVLGRCWSDSGSVTEGRKFGDRKVSQRLINSEFSVEDPGYRCDSRNRMKGIPI